MRGRTMRGAVIGVVLVAAVGGGVMWTQGQETYAPGTIAVGVQPQGVAVDVRVGRAFVATAGVNGDSHTISVLDTLRGTLLRTVNVGSGPWSVAVDQQTGRLFVANGGYYDRHGLHGAGIAVLDTRSLAVLRRIPVNGSTGTVMIDPLRGVAVVPVYSAASGATTIYELDARSGRVARTTTRYSALLAVDRVTRHIFVAKGASILVIDARDNRVVRVIPTGMKAPLYSGAVVTDERTGRLFVVDYSSGLVSIFNTRTGSLMRSVAVGINPLRLAADPRTARVFVVNQGHISAADHPDGAGSVSVLDARTGAVLRTVTLDLNAVAVAVDERRGLVLVTTAGPTGLPDNGPVRKGKLYILDARTGAIRHVLAVGTGPYNIAEDAATGRAIVANSYGNGGSFNGPQQWYLEWVPHHPPMGTVSVLSVTR